MALSLPLIILTIILFLILVIGIILLIWGLIEPTKLQVNHVSLDKDADNNPDLTICFLSDLHIEFCFIKPEAIIEAMRQEMKHHKIDMVVFGGDIANNPKKALKGITYLNKINDFCKENGIIFAGVNGNHDVTLSHEDFMKCGFINLNEDDVILNVPLKSSNDSIENTYFVTGVRDSGRHNRVWSPVRMPLHSEYKTVLISHNPDQLLNLSGNTNINYCLSGHIHGGQIRTPFGIEFSVLRKDILPKRGIFQGSHNFNGTKLYISRGIGCVLFPFRIGSLPEFNIFYLKNR